MKNKNPSIIWNRLAGVGLFASFALACNAEPAETEIRVLSPAAGSFTTVGSLCVVSRVSNLPSGAWVRVNGKKAFANALCTGGSGAEFPGGSSGPEFSARVFLPDAGPGSEFHPSHPIKIQALTSDGNTLLAEQNLTVARSQSASLGSTVRDAFAMQLVDDQLAGKEIGLRVLERRIEQFLRDDLDLTDLIPRVTREKGCRQQQLEECPHFILEFLVPGFNFIKDAQGDEERCDVETTDDKCENTGLVGDRDCDGIPFEIDYCRVFELTFQEVSPLESGVAVDIQEGQTSIGVDLEKFSAGFKMVEVTDQTLWPLRPCSNPSGFPAEWGGECLACRGTLFVGNSETHAAYSQDAKSGSIDVDQTSPVSLKLAGPASERCENGANLGCFVPYGNESRDQAGYMCQRSVVVDTVLTDVLDDFMTLDQSEIDEGKTSSELEDLLARVLGEPDKMPSGVPDLDDTEDGLCFYPDPDKPEEQISKKQPDFDPRDCDAPIAGVIEGQFDKLDLEKPFAEAMEDLAQELDRDPIDIALNFEVADIREHDAGIVYTANAGFSVPGTPKFKCPIAQGVLPPLDGRTSTLLSESDYGFAVAVSTNVLNEALCAAASEDLLSATLTKVPDPLDPDNLFARKDATAGTLGEILGIRERLVAAVNGNQNELLELHVSPTTLAPHFRQDAVALARFDKLVADWGETFRPHLALLLSDVGFEVRRRPTFAQTRGDLLFSWRLTAWLGARLRHSRGSLSPLIITYPWETTDPAHYPPVQVDIDVNKIGLKPNEIEAFEGSVRQQGRIQSFVGLASDVFNDAFLFNPILFPSFEKIGMAPVEIATREAGQTDWSHLIAQFELGSPPELLEMGDQCLPAEPAAPLLMNAVATDVEKRAITYTVRPLPLPVGARFFLNGNAYRFEWRPTKEQGQQEGDKKARAYEFTFGASVPGDVWIKDAGIFTSFVDQETLKVFVLKPDGSCQVTLDAIGSRNATSGQELKFDISAAGPPGVRVRFQVESGDPKRSLPVGVKLNPEKKVLDQAGKASATFSWTPEKAQAGEDHLLRFSTWIGLKKWDEELVTIRVR